MKSGTVPIVIVLSVGLAWGSVLALNAPGHLSYDSVVQLAEGRNLTYQSMHPPLMSALLGVGDRLIRGTGLYLMLVSGIFFFSLVLLSMRARRPTLTAISMLIVSLSPHILIYQGIVWKDVLFANLSILAFALLYEVSQRIAEAPPQKVRFLFYFSSVLLSGISALVRQNGILVPFFIAVAIACVELQKSRKTRWQDFRLGVAISVIAFGISMLSALAVSTIVRVTASTASSDSTYLGLQSLFIYDIVAISALAEDRVYAPLVARDINPESFVRNAQEVYSPERIDYISISGVLDEDLSTLTQAGINDVWRELVTQNPRYYLSHRVAVLSELLWPTRPERCLPVHIGISGPEALMSKLQLTPGQRVTDQALYSYSQRFFGTFSMLPISYLIGALGMIAFLTTRLRQGSIPIVFMLIASVCFALSYVAIGIACDMRYVYFLISSVLAALVYFVASGLHGEGDTS